MLFFSHSFVSSFQDSPFTGTRHSLEKEAFIDFAFFSKQETNVDEDLSHITELILQVAVADQVRGRSRNMLSNMECEYRFCVNFGICMKIRTSNLS